MGHPVAADTPCTQEIITMGHPVAAFQSTAELPVCVCVCGWVCVSVLCVSVCPLDFKLSGNFPPNHGTIFYIFALSFDNKNHKGEWDHTQTASISHKDMSASLTKTCQHL